MAGFLSFLKTILIPALISLIVYVFLTNLLLPFIRRHRHRYNEYLPLPLPSLSSTTPSNLRQRLSSSLISFLVPSRWRRQHHVVDGSYAGDEELFDDEEGEGMVGFEIDERRREALERRRSGGPGEEEAGRLGRDLEEGFRDDSEDEEEEAIRETR